VSSVAVGAGQAGAPLLDARGEVLGMAVAARDRARTRQRVLAGGLPGTGGVAPASGDPEDPNLRSRLLSQLLVAAGDSRERAAPFATFVPASEMRRIVGELKTAGRVRRGMLGVRLLRPEPVVGEVVAGTPAEAAGVGAGDRVVSLDGVAVDDTEVLTAYLQRRAPGTRVRVALRDPGGVERETEAVLAELPAAPPPPAARQLFNGFSVQAVPSYDTSAAKFSIGVPATGSVSLVANEVDEDSAAWAAGIRPGDWIVEIDGRPLLSEKDFRDATTGPAALASAVRVLVYRAGDAERRALVLK
jgi:S1-C subfamily serine protease